MNSDMILLRKSKAFSKYRTSNAARVFLFPYLYCILLCMSTMPEQRLPQSNKQARSTKATPHCE